MPGLKIVEEARKPLAMNSKKFALWLFMVSISMLFAAWTSAYIVRRGEGEWFYFELPDLFWLNTCIIVVSSATMILAVRSARKDEINRVNLAIGITMVLGLAFLAGQWMAWQKMIEMNAYFTGGNVSSSFVYVITGFHGLHIISGLVFLCIVLVQSMNYHVHSRNMNLVEMCSTYWHFLDVLWVYLFIFLLLNR